VLVIEWIAKVDAVEHALHNAARICAVLKKRWISRATALALSRVDENWRGAPNCGQATLSPGVR
jgi:hypothetical protein